MIELYWGLWMEKNGPTFESLGKEEKELSARWFGHIEDVRDMGKEIQNDDYSEIRRNSVVFLADILENLVESFIHVCLEHYLPDSKSASDITGSKRLSNTYESYRRAIRHWERSLGEKSRMARVKNMTRVFFPLYDFPVEKSTNLDGLIASRNELTHELIDIRRRTRFIPSEDEVQIYFNCTGDFIISLIDVFVAQMKTGSSTSPTALP
ncbi:MAG: hypothetical protein ABL962_19735 [Fimbriimonadaceae bacterium]